MVNIYEILRRNQDGTSDYVQECLKSLNIPFTVDSYGNIYNLDNENAPLLSAHMDTIRKDADKVIGTFLQENDDEEKIFTGGILGGDDKCGVYIMLRVLEKNKNVNFVFSRDEEIGCLGISAFVKCADGKTDNLDITEKLKKCLYCLVLDRRGNADIICKANDYGTEAFEEALEKVSKDNGFIYKHETGLLSDADIISEYISTANLSVGYYSPHSKKEYIVKKELETALDYVEAIIREVTTKFDAPDKTFIYKKPKGGSSYLYSDYYDDYDSYATKYYKYYYNQSFDYDDGYYYNPTKKSDSGGDKKKDSVDFVEDGNIREEGKTCDFCFFPSDDNEEYLQPLKMPDGNVLYICEFCFDDLEYEIKKTRALFEAEAQRSGV